MPPSDREQLTQALQALQEHPTTRPPQIKRLKGFSFPLYRLRSGDYRVLYSIDETLVTVMRVINRRDLDRILGQFK